MKLNNLLLPFILTVFLSIPSFASSYISGKVVAVDASGNISVEIPQGRGPVGIGDEVVVQESAFGGIAVYQLGKWKTVDVHDRLVKAEVVSLESPEQLPQPNMTALIYTSGDIHPDLAGKTDPSFEEKDPLPARRQKKCDNGDMKACTALALMYKNGDRVPKDPNRAFDLMRKAAEGNYPEAGVQLSYFYLFGTGVQASQQMADQWLIKTAEKGYVKAQGDLGYSYMIRKDYENAMKWYRLAAEKGEKVSQFKLGVLFGYDRYADNGSLLMKADYKQAAYWYRKAAEQHVVEAQDALAELYEWGRGVPKDRDEAIKWYRRAAARGSATAQYALERIGVPVNGPEQTKPLPRFVPPELQGVHVVDLTPAIRQKHNINEAFKGVLVTDVDKGSQADELLLPGDLLMRLNGSNIRNMADYETFASIFPADDYDALSVNVLRTDYFVDVELSSSAKVPASEILTDQSKLEDLRTDKEIIPEQQDTLDDEWEDL